MIEFLKGSGGGNVPKVFGFLKISGDLNVSECPRQVLKVLLVEICLICPGVL